MTDSITSLYSSNIGVVWQHFVRISEIPRPSKQEQKIREYLKGIAQRRKWETREDCAGNLVFKIPGHGVLEKQPILVLQGHMDMVCEKNSDVIHDFSKDPIRLKIDGTWVVANGTTLGADNGIALAMMLSLAESELPDRVPLELLFTVDEETGLTGAMNLDKSLVKGRILLNLDSEDDRVLTIGCAGGRDVMVSYRYGSIEPVLGSPSYTVHIKGLRGGHSGVNIHEGRTNSLIFAAQLLDKIKQSSPELAILDFHGGDKKNAIPREAIFSVMNCENTKLQNIVNDSLEHIRKFEKKAEIIVHSSNITTQNKTIPFELITFLNSIPNGVIAMDPNFPDFVQTSSNVGVLCDRASRLELLIHARSSAKKALCELEQHLQVVTADNGGVFSLGPGYPGWEPNPKSKLLERCRTIYKTLFDQEPSIVPMHAGLEAGILGDILGTQELLSIGPTIKDPHSPAERVNIESVGMIYQFLKYLVSNNKFMLG